MNRGEREDCKLRGEREERKQKDGVRVLVRLIRAGFAMPVVSRMIRSKSLRRLLSFVSALTRSPRTVQQAQPLSSEMISSATSRFSWTSEVSMSTLPNSFSMTHTFSPVLLVSI